MVPNPNEGDEAVAPPAAAPNPLPNSGFGASSAGLLRLLPPNRPDDGALDVAPPPPNMPPGLLAGVFDAPPPKRFDAPVGAPPPNRPEPPPGVLAPELPVLAVPKSEGVDPPDVLLATAPNKGLFGMLPLFCCPKLKPDMSCCSVLCWDDTRCRCCGS